MRTVGILILSLFVAAVGQAAANQARAQAPASSGETEGTASAAAPPEAAPPEAAPPEAAPPEAAPPKAAPPEAAPIEEQGTATSSPEAQTESDPRIAQEAARYDERMPEVWRLHGLLGATTALGEYQETEFGWGLYGAGAVEYMLTDEIGLQLELGALWLGEGDPSTRGFPVGNSWLVMPALGVRARPFFGMYDGESVAHVAGLWASGAVGVAFTGDLVRAGIDAAIGWDLLFNEGRLGIGPMFGWLHVFQPNDSLRPEDANLIFFGVHAVLGFAKQPPDRDGDGIPDAYDRCPDDPEDMDGFQDEDGCPDWDNDGDGIRDADDRCPNDPEDMDGFQDEDGCPDPDNDGDGFADLVDLCPYEPETFNGYADNDGCPDVEQVRVTGEHIVLDEQVLFQTEQAVIEPASHPLLEKLARFLNDHPEYVHVRVEGHTDERGSDTLNQRLSEARAKSVRDFLVSKGVAKDRLSHKGYGSSRPRLDRHDALAYTLNRRVEFHVTRGPRATSDSAAASSDTADSPAPEGSTEEPATTTPSDESSPSDANEDATTNDNATTTANEGAEVTQ